MGVNAVNKIPDPPNRKPSNSLPDPRDANMNALKGEAVGIADDTPIQITHNESEREVLERAQRGGFRRIF